MARKFNSAAARKCREKSEVRMNSMAGIGSQKAVLPCKGGYFSFLISPIAHTALVNFRCLDSFHLNVVGMLLSTSAEC